MEKGEGESDQDPFSKSESRKEVTQEAKEKAPVEEIDQGTNPCIFGIKNLHPVPVEVQVQRKFTEGIHQDRVEDSNKAIGQKDQAGFIGGRNRLPGKGQGQVGLAQKAKKRVSELGDQHADNEEGDQGPDHKFQAGK